MNCFQFVIILSSCYSTRICKTCRCRSFDKFKTTLLTCYRAINFVFLCTFLFIPCKFWFATCDNITNLYCRCREFCNYCCITNIIVSIIPSVIYINCIPFFFCSLIVYLFERIPTFKSTITYDLYTFRNRDGFKRITISKCFFTNNFDTLWNHNRFNSVTITECPLFYCCNIL